MEPRARHGDQVLLGARVRGALFNSVRHIPSQSNLRASVRIDVCVYADSAHDNSRFASSGGDRQVFLWDVMTGQTIRRIPGHMGKIFAVEFNEDASVLASGEFVFVSSMEGRPKMLRYLKARTIRP